MSVSVCARASVSAFLFVPVCVACLPVLCVLAFLPSGALNLLRGSFWRVAFRACLLRGSFLAARRAMLLAWPVFFLAWSVFFCSKYFKETAFI